MLFESCPEIIIEKTDKIQIVLEHGARTANVALRLAENLGLQNHLDALQIAAELHDLGKEKLPDEIFYNKGTLSPEETELMHTHPAKALELLGKKFIDKNPIAAMLILLHHPEYGERRKNYQPINQELIPLLICLIAADKMVSMTEDRLYRPKAKLLPEIIQEISASLNILTQKYCLPPMVTINQLPLKTIYAEAINQSMI